MLHGGDSAVGDLADRAVDWIKQRLASSPVGVIGDKAVLDAALGGSITDAGLGLDQAWQQFFEQVVAPNNIGLDSERFLAFIPLSPSVAVGVDGRDRVGGELLRRSRGWREPARLPPRTR